MNKLKAIWGYPDFKNEAGDWVRSWCTGSVAENNKTQHHTLSDGRWSDICKRSKLGGRYQKLKPTYVGVENKFKDFNDFVDWSQGEVGYSEKEPNGNFWSIDKDILFPNNKYYSSETCLFVPNKVNCFLLACSSARGKYPVGVSFSKNNNFFTAFSNSSLGNSYLGVFDNPKDAHRAWQESKIKAGYELAKDYINLHPKLYRAIINNIKNIEEDYNCNRETIL